MEKIGGAEDLLLRSSWEMSHGVPMPAFRTEVDVALMLVDKIPEASRSLDLAQLVNVRQVVFENSLPGV